MAKTIGSFDLASLKNLRDDVTQYFWFESDSSSAWGSGAHVTLYPESQFTNPSHANYMKGQNIIMNTDGFSIRNGGLPMMVLDNDSLDFNVVDTTTGTYVTTATFTNTGAWIGRGDSSHSVIDAYGQRFYAIDGTTQLANIGYGEGVNPTGGSSVAPYYTFGTRSSTTVGNYSVVEGRSNNATGANSHAEGWTTSATAANSHAEGFTTRATGAHSHAEGGPNALSSGELIRTTASGAASHAEGWGTKASGDGSHSQNDMTIAAKSAQTALGTYNIEDTASTTTHPNGYASYGQYAVIVGNGTSSARSNALTVDWQGNVDASGSVITTAKYNDAHNAGSSAGYSVTVSSLAGSTYLGQAIRLATVASMSKFPIFNGFDISGTGTARIHTLGHYIYKSTYNGQEYWTAYIKMRNDNTSAISNFTVTAYIAWV